MNFATFLAIALGLPAPPMAMRLAVAATAAPQVTESKTLVGQIVEIDPARGTVVVTESTGVTRPKENAPKPQRVTVSLTRDTLLVRGKSPTAIQDLKPKEYVVVRYKVTPAGATAVSFRVAAAVVPRPTVDPSTASGSSAAPSGSTQAVAE